MTQDNSYIFLNRLIVTTHTGAYAYDELFHKGVNIIRGKNSSGKSTISNFIFYILGGDYNNWNAESLKCREVFAEVSINNATYTLKRTITTSLKQPMSIFWGNFEQAKSDIINWKTFSYSQSDERLSFSSILFKALSYTEVRSESDNNITLHQLLRLIYIDQDSPTQCLFRRENFDLPAIRQAVSEMLLGVYDDSLYNDRLTLRKANKDYDVKKREFDSLTKLYSQSGNATSVSELNTNIEFLNKKLNDTQLEITKTKEGSQKIKISKNSITRVGKIQKELLPIKQKFKELNSEVYQLDLDIIDSKYFIEMLQKRVIELNNSILAKKVLGELTLSHCPECLNPLENHTPVGHCSLCKQSLDEEEERSHAKRLKQEIEIQIKESQGLLIKKGRRIVEKRSSLPEYKSKINFLQKDLDLAISESQSSRDNKIDDLYILKGNTEKELEILIQQTKGIDLIELLKKELSELKLLIEKLKLSIQQKDYSQKVNRDKAMAQIGINTVKILKSDLDRQGEFMNARNVDIDFYGDSFSLDGNFNFSASSNTYFKNAIRFAIFFSSLQLGFMRYPKFIFCDNMEDKGMEKERTQNLQNLIVKISNSFSDKVEHQIIFSTSMIADNLNNTPYCVGDDYDQNNKTLKV